jgi:hypothetical protein
MRLTMTGRLFDLLVGPWINTPSGLARHIRESFRRFFQD